MTFADEGLALAPNPGDHAERFVLSILLAHPERLPVPLDVEDFGDGRNGKVYEVVRELHEQGLPVDLVMVADALRARFPKWSSSMSYAAGLATNENPTFLRNYVDEVKERAARRRLSETMTLHAARLAGAEPLGLAEVATVKSDYLQEISAIEVAGDSGSVPMTEAVAMTREEIERARKGERIPALETGLRDVDRILGGVRPGVAIVAARTSVGKSLLALSVAATAASNHWEYLGGPASVVFVSLEMRLPDIVKRLLSNVSGVPYSDIENGRLNEANLARLGEAYEQIGRLPIHWISKRATVAEICDLARSKHRAGKCDLLVVDYIQLVPGFGSVDERRLEVAEVSRALSELALEIDIPILAVSQLNRQAENADKPQLSHLAESTSLEMDADVVLLLNRPDENDPSKLAIRVAKNRNGPCGEVTVRMDASRFRIEDDDPIDTLARKEVLSQE